MRKDESKKKITESGWSDRKSGKERKMKTTNRKWMGRKR